MLFATICLALALASTPAFAKPSFTILLPCSASASSHAIVPDASCQLVSPNGAFSVASLAATEPNVALGFSSTPDCASTYTPDRDELVQLHQNQTCRSFVVKADPEYHLLDESNNSKDKESDTKDEKGDTNDSQAKDKENAKKDAEGDGRGWMRKRFLEVKDGAEERAVGYGDDVSLDQDPQLPAGHVPLKYVMLVQV
uniref:Uncharacterized protein n=2 Tax=Kalmanozyma brasiliensis (strain GHG001) TaxID=1365824 RepID=V5EPU4_KALBG